MSSPIQMPTALIRSEWPPMIASTSLPEHQTMSSEGLRKAARMLEYLWTATGKDPATHVCDLFGRDDPIWEDMTRIIDESRAALAAQPAAGELDVERLRRALVASSSSFRSPPDVLARRIAREYVALQPATEENRTESGHATTGERDRG